MRDVVLPWGASRLPGAEWLLLGAGFLCMYLPTYLEASRVLWQTDDFGHGPIILAVAVWLAWRVKDAVAGAPRRPDPVLGWPLAALGLLLYVAGRSLGISSIEFLSQPVVVAAALLLVRGRGALRAAWFPVLYLVFMVPLPGTLVDMLTAPLKQWISLVVVDVLHALGYPIARGGVIITIGPYQLLVADACSGLNSMFSLSALGVLFMYLMRRRDALHNAIMLASILPIAFVANMIRVIMLVLVTYHLGDEAGQGFVHGAAGIVLMLVALATFFALDAVLRALLPRLHRPRVATP